MPSRGAVRSSTAPPKSGRVGIAGSAAYTASKHGVIGMTKCAFPNAPATPRSARCATSPLGCVPRRRTGRLISSRIAGAVEAVVKLEDLGNLELKGLRRPVAAFNVVQSSSAADARPNLTFLARWPRPDRRQREGLTTVILQPGRRRSSRGRGAGDDDAPAVDPAA